MATHCRFLTIGLFMPLWMAAAVVGQAQPKSFKELRSRIESAKSVEALVKSIGLVYRFRSSGTREFLCKALGTYRDPEVRCAIYKQMARHPHAQILKQLQKGFRPGTPPKELDAIVTGLAGQGRAGQMVLTAGVSSKDTAIRQKSIDGLRHARDPSEATLSLLRVFNKSDLETRVRILNNLVAMKSAGLALARVERLAFHILAKDKNTGLRLAALKQLHGGRTKSATRALVALKKEFEVSKSSSLIEESARGLLSHDRPGLSILLKALQSSSSQRRDAAVSVLGARGDNRRVTLALIEQFQDAKPQLQATLFGILSRHEVIPQLTALRLSVLESQSVSMRAQALSQLARMNHKVVASKALEMAGDKDVRKSPSASAQVFFALGTVLGRSTLPIFLGLGSKRDRDVDSNWRSLLVEHQKKVLPLVAGRALALPDLEHRLVATYLLTQVNASKDKFKDITADGLVRALRDKSRIVVVTAMRALVQQRNRRVIPILEANIESMDEDIRVQAMLGLHKFRGSSAAWGARLLKILRNTTGASRLVALDLVTKLKLRPALSVVRGLFHHETWQVRSAAYFFCLQVRDTASIVPLIARLDKEDGRLHAEVLGTLRALTNLTYRGSKDWRTWWVEHGRDFEMPPLRKKAGVGRGAPAAMTYYSMALNSNRVGFLVDTSGSMSAKVGTSGITRLDLAKKALSQIIEKCGEGFHFNLITFGSDGRRWKRELCPATVANRDSARQYVKGMRTGGGTNFFEALLMAFEDESIDTIYLLSDGTPTEGDITDQQELADEIELWNVKRRILIHTISIGADSSVMRRLAADSGGDHVQRR